MSAASMPLILVPVHRGSAASGQALRPPVPAPPRPTSDAERRAVRVGIQQERKRWLAVLGSRAFGSQPVVAAHLLATTDMSASAILGALRAMSADTEVARPNSPAAIDARWAAAFQRADGGRQ